MVGGNTTAIIQKKSATGKNAIGEPIESWSDVGTVLGWLDYSSGQNDIQTYQAKIQDTTHLFLCDFEKWKEATQDASITSENSRLIVDEDIYTILMIDDPMKLHDHMEIYLQYVGGGQGV